MYRIVVCASVVLLLSVGCSRVETPNVGTNEAPYVETSFSYGTVRSRAVTPPKPAAPRNSVLIGDTTYSVIETTQGFSVLTHAAPDASVISRENYTVTDTEILALSSPRIHDVASTSFVVTFRATTKTGTASPSYTVTTSPVRITQR